MTVIKRRRRQTKYQVGQIVKHVREPNSIGLVTEVVRNIPLPGSKALASSIYQVFWSAGSDKGCAADDCWYGETELQGIKEAQ